MNALIVCSGSDGFPSTKQAPLFCQPTQLITNQNGMRLFNLLTTICKSWKGHLRMNDEPWIFVAAPERTVSNGAAASPNNINLIERKNKAE